MQCIKVHYNNRIVNLQPGAWLTRAVADERRAQTPAAPLLVGLGGTGVDGQAKIATLCHVRGLRGRRKAGWVHAIP